MDLTRLRQLTDRYAALKIAVLGDFCLDRYLEIDPALQEISLETGLPVHNVVCVRPQAGAAGTVLNNLVALGVGEIVAIGFSGEDGEGFELNRALAALRGVRTDALVNTPLRRTFTYTKPLVMVPGQPPCELNRLDSKNWTPTPAEVEEQLIAGLHKYASQLDALIVMDQVDMAETGVVTRNVLAAVGQLARQYPRLRIVADSRRGLRDYPPVTLKMNRAELAKLLGKPALPDVAAAQQAARELAVRGRQDVIVTLAEAGIVGATPTGEVAHVPTLPVRGPIDIVGAGDAVMANLTAALAAGASLTETLEIANAAAHLVIHQLGTTGTATAKQLAEALAGWCTGADHVL